MVPVIRPLEATDIDAAGRLLADLAHEFIVGSFEPAARQRFLAENNAEGIRHFIASGFRYHVALVEGALVGFVGMRGDSHLYHLFVAKALHGQGIGRALWDAAQAACRTAGHDGAFTVNASTFAVPVYERWGFRHDGPVKETNGIICHPMRLERMQ